GAEVAASRLGSMSWLQALGLPRRLMLARALPRTPRKYATNPLWNHHRGADGEWIALAMIQSDRYWPGICAALGVPDAATDPRFATLLDRMMNAGDCVAVLDATFATRPRAEWRDLVRKGGHLI